MSITETSLGHPTTQNRIFQAMRIAIRKSQGLGVWGAVYINNSKGNPFLRVKHCRKYGFSFSTRNLLVTDRVIRSLRSPRNELVTSKLIASMRN